MTHFFIPVTFTSISIPAEIAAQLSFAAKGNIRSKKAERTNLVRSYL